MQSKNGATASSAKINSLFRNWKVQAIAIETSVQLKITGRCGRCVMTTLAQGDLSSDPGILRPAAQHNQVNVGAYAAVVRSGTVHPVRIA